MITVTWVYQRPNKDMPFYRQSTTEAVERQKKFEDLKNECGLVAGVEQFDSDDGLSYTTIWKYHNIEDYINFMNLVSERCPTHVTARNDYVISNNHFVTATASEPVFFIDGSLTNVMTIGNLTP